MNDVMVSRKGGAVSDIDYGLACEFWDERGRPLQMRFRRDYAPPGSGPMFADTGQLLAVVDDVNRDDHGDEVPLTRQGVSRSAVEELPWRAGLTGRPSAGTSSARRSAYLRSGVECRSPG